MKKQSLQFVTTTSRWKQVLAVTLACVTFGYALQADPLPVNLLAGTWSVYNPGPGGMVTAGNVIVPVAPVTTGQAPPVTPVVEAGPIVMPPPPVALPPTVTLDQLETKLDLINGPHWAISDDAPQGLTVALSPAGVVKAPMASFFLDAAYGHYDDSVGAVMGCQVLPAFSDGRLGEQISCPLVSKLKPTIFTFSDTTTGAVIQQSATCLGAPLSGYEGMDITPVANTICMLRPGSSYSNYFFQCGINSESGFNIGSGGQKYCDAATVKFPVRLNITDQTKNQTLLGWSIPFEVQNAEQTLSANFTTTFGKILAVTNPEQLGWIKVQEVKSSSSSQPSNTCLSTSGVSMMALFNTCHESRGVEIAEVVMVGVASMIVGAFAGEALSGAAGIIRGTSALRFLVDADDTPSEAYSVFLG